MNHRGWEIIPKNDRVLRGKGFILKGKRERTFQKLDVFFLPSYRTEFKILLWRWSKHLISDEQNVCKLTLVVLNPVDYNIFIFQNFKMASGGSTLSALRTVYDLKSISAELFHSIQILHFIFNIQTLLLTLFFNHLSIILVYSYWQFPHSLPANPPSNFSFDRIFSLFKPSITELNFKICL